MPDYGFDETRSTEFIARDEPIDADMVTVDAYRTGDWLVKGTDGGVHVFSDAAFRSEFEPLISHRERILREISEERERQMEKFGHDFEGRDPWEWLTILLEEAGEAVEAIANGDEHAQVEIVQCAAVLVCWLEHFDTQGRTNQDPSTAIFAMDLVTLGDKAKVWLDQRGLG